MKSNPLISVIVPIYKVEEYLKECVDSILAQTYTNLEIILINDGSPDNCGKICDEYAKQDEIIKVIHKDNGGLSDARNVGLDICKGEYITFVDSDDMIHPLFIETLYKNLVEHQVDISFCDFKRFEHSRDLKISSIGEVEKVNLDGNYMINNLYTKEWLPKNVVVWNKIYKQSIFQKLRFPKGLNHEDEYIFLDVYKNNPKVMYCSFEGYFYRYAPNSIMTNRYTDKNIMSYSTTLINRRKKFIKNRELLNKTEKRLSIYLTNAFFENPKFTKNIIRDNAILKVILLNPYVLWKTKLLFLFKFIIT